MLFKKSFIISLLLTIIICFYSQNNVVDAATYRNIGHDDIIEITVNNSSFVLLKDMSDKTITNYLNKVKRKAFGWEAYSINSEVKCKYVSQIIFAKSNLTQEPIKYNYTLKYSQTAETQVSKTGSIAGKLSGKLSGVTPGVEASLEKETTSKTKTFYEEKTTFTMQVNPGKKLSLRVTGDAVISNGVGRYYFLGIVFKKGTWEYIDKTNEFYEMYEEDI